MLLRTLVWALVVGLLVAPAGATTPKSITVDGTLSDFDDATELRPVDPFNDSTFTAGADEVGKLYVTWDSQALYVGFDFSVEQAAVIYYVQGAAVGSDDFCALNAFPASLRTSEKMDVMLAAFADQAFHGYVLSGTTATEDAAISLARTANPANGSPGAAEARIPWSKLFPGSPTTVPNGATIKLLGVIRGTQDGDLLGDINPNQTLSNANCAGGATMASTYHVIHVDSDGNGEPDDDYNPGTDSPVGTPPDGGPDGGPDAGPGDMAVADQPVGNDVVAGDMAVSSDGEPMGDGPSAPDRAGGDMAPQDRRLADLPPPSDRRAGGAPDGGAPTPSMGCTCEVGRDGPGRPDLAALLLAALGLLLLRRRSAR